MKIPIFFALLLITQLLQAIPTGTYPLYIESSTVIELTEDIIITTRATPVVATTPFGNNQPERVIITSKTKNSIIITKTGIWDLTSFDAKNKIIEFRGNARLICEPGAKIIFNNGVLRFCESSRWIIE